MGGSQKAREDSVARRMSRRDQQYHTAKKTRINIKKIFFNFCVIEISSRGGNGGLFM